MTLLNALLSRRDPEERTVTDEALWGAWRRGEDLDAPNIAGVTVDRNSALGLSAVWACVSLIGDSVATLPIDAFTTDKTGVKSSLTPRPSWMDYPNPEQTKVDFVFGQVASLLLDGIAPVYTLRDRRGDVIEAYSVDPRWVQIYRERQPDGSYKIVYHVSVVKGQQSPVGPFVVPMGPEMFHINAFQPSSSNPRGISPLERARLMFGGAIGGQEMGARYYGQGMNAAGVIEVPADVTFTTPQAQQLKQDFASANAGLKKMHLPPVLTGGATWKQIQITPEQSQFLQAREFAVDEIARWFRVPPHMIGHMVRETSWGSGIEYQGMNFVNYTLRPWIERLEWAWSRWMLLFQPGARAGFDVSGLLRGDHTSRANWYASGKQWGWLNTDEIRANEGLPPLADDEGQVYLRPVNMVDASAPPPDPTQVVTPPDSLTQGEAPTQPDAIAQGGGK